MTVEPGRMQEPEPIDRRSSEPPASEGEAPAASSTTRGARRLANRSNVWSTKVGRVTVKLLLAILITLSAVAVVRVMRTLTLVVVPVLLALLLAAAISPFVQYLNRKNIPKLAATWIALLTIVTVLAGVSTAIIYSISSQWNQLVTSSNFGFARLETSIANSPLPFSAQEIRQAREAAIQSVRESLSFGDAMTAVTFLTTLFTGLILMAVVLFFFLRDGHNIWLFLTTPLKGKWLDKTQKAGEGAIKTMGGYLRGTATIALIDAVGIGIAMFFIGIPLVLPLTALIFLGGFIPIIGATLTGIFAVLVAYVSNGSGAALALAAAVIIVQQAEGNLLQPFIMGHAVKLHPLVILLVLAIGAVLAGVIGAILAVPIAAATWTVFKVWKEQPGQGSHAIE